MKQAKARYAYMYLCKALNWLKVICMVAMKKTAFLVVYIINLIRYDSCHQELGRLL